MTEKDLFLDHFAQFDNRWASAPVPVCAQSARKRFHDLSFPGPKTEDWRFTSVAGLLRTPFEPAVDETSVAPSQLPPLCEDNALRLTFVNGHFTSHLSTINDLPHGVYVGNLAGAVKSQAESFVGKFSETKDQIFPTLNTSLFHDGAFVWLADWSGTRTAHRSFSTSPNQAASLWPFIRAPWWCSAKTARPRCWNAIRDQESTLTMPSPKSASPIMAGSIITSCRKTASMRFTWPARRSFWAPASNFTSHYLTWGARLSRNEVRVRFDAENSEATVNGLYVGSGRQHVDNFTVIDHAQPHCASHELYKGILSGQAQGVFNGKIFVREGAQKTDAKQTNKVLLLSENATIHTKPQLEIFADDVKCTHGATVGQLDDEQIFYLRSRGLSLAEARDLLTYAFVNNILEKVKLPALREHLAKAHDYRVSQAFQPDLSAWKG